MKVLDSAVPVACWSCAVAHNESTLFCPHCSKIQPPAGVDYFSVLGLEPHLNLDLAVLESEFHRLSRRLHPDRFVRATDSEKGWSLADTALLNDAYRTLKDPLRRTEYLLKLQGVEIRERSAEGDEKERRDPSRVPADLLEEVFDLNMQIEELRDARGVGGNEPAVSISVAEAKKKFDGLVIEVDRDLRAQWQAWDAGDEETRTAAQNAMVALLDRRRYLSNLMRDIKQVLGE
jgi:molecular chaperone HscB